MSEKSTREATAYDAVYCAANAAINTARDSYNAAHAAYAAAAAARIEAINAARTTLEAALRELGN